MTPRVLILVTVRPGIGDYATLVFDSVRKGFPTADITVVNNGGEDDHWETSIQDCCRRVHARYTWQAEMPFHDWIYREVKRADKPFFIVDTDVVFHDGFERWTFDPRVPTAGRYIPELVHNEHCTISARLHPSMLWINPVVVRERMRELRTRCQGLESRILYGTPHVWVDKH